MLRLRRLFLGPAPLQRPNGLCESSCLVVIIVVVVDNTSDCNSKSNPPSDFSISYFMPGVCNLQSGLFSSNWFCPQDKNELGDRASCPSNIAMEKDIYPTNVCIQGLIQDFGQRGPTSFDPKGGGGPEPKLRSKYGFSLKIAWKLRDFKKILGPRAGGPPGSATGISRLLAGSTRINM